MIRPILVLLAFTGLLAAPAMPAPVDGLSGPAHAVAVSGVPDCCRPHAEPCCPEVVPDTSTCGCWQSAPGGSPPVEGTAPDRRTDDSLRMAFRLPAEPLPVSASPAALTVARSLAGGVSPRFLHQISRLNC